jgi:membrane AbrB-like protein
LIRTLGPLLAGLAFLCAARFLNIPGGAFIGAITGGALVRIVFAGSKQPPAPLQNLARLILGLSIGVQVNRQAIDAALSVGIPVACMVTGLITFSFLFAWLASRLTGMDFITALCGASPGAGSAMIILAGELGGDSPVVAVIHTIKIAMILVLIPVLTGVFQTAQTSAVIQAARVPDSFPVYYGKLAFLVAGGFVSAKFMRKGGVPTAEIIGGILLAAVCNPLFLQIEAFPSLWQFFAIWIVGTSIGSQINRGSLKAIRKYALTCLILVLALTALGLVLGWILYKTTSMGILTALIGTCPTGLDAMVILAAEIHTNVPLVAAMHTSRVIIVMLLMPLIIRRITKKIKTEK